MLFILISMLLFFLFFTEIKKGNKYTYILLPFLFAIMLRLQFVFIILIGTVSVYLLVEWSRNHKILKLTLFLFLNVFLTILIFILKPIPARDYFMLANFSIPSLSAIFNNLFIYPRTNPIILILVFWLFLFNIIELYDEKNKCLKNELKIILSAEISISLIYLIFYSAGNLSGQFLYLGIFPFIPLNIFYFYCYINRLNFKLKYTLMGLFIFFSIIELVPYRIYSNIIIRILQFI